MTTPWVEPFPLRPRDSPTSLLGPRRRAETLSDLPTQEQAEFAAPCGWVHDALLARGDVGRVGLHIGGYGAAHLHVWLISRPFGELELRAAP